MCSSARHYDWPEKWQIEFNVGKCSVMSVDRTNPTHNYSLNDTSLSKAWCERDSGAIMSPVLRLLL